MAAQVAGSIPRKHPDELRLDLRNPRLTGFRPVDEAQVIQRLVVSEDLQELIDSIAANGFVPLEPLIVTREDDGLVVLEGNRRLAAVRVLLNDELRIAVGVPKREVPQELQSTLLELPVLEVPNRESARQLIGFKHINGPQKWSAYAKAQFALDWYREERTGGTGASIEDIAAKLGDGHRTLRRMVQGLMLVEQAERHGLFNREDVHPSTEFYFSHLYTALGRTPYQEFLGLEEFGTGELQEDPVPDSHFGQLGDVLRWLYGSKSDDELPRIRRQAPDVKYLGHVIVHADAVEAIRTGASLEVAYKRAQPDESRFVAAIYAALRAAEEALPLAPQAHPDDDILEVARKLSRLAKTLVFVLENPQGD